MNNFEPVEKGDPTETDQMFISISPKGMFYIPNRVYERHLDGVHHIALGKDVEEKRIILRATEEEGGRNVYPLKDNRGYGKRFSSKTVVTALGMEMDSSVRLEPTWDDHEGGVVLDASEVSE